MNGFSKETYYQNLLLSSIAFKGSLVSETSNDRPCESLTSSRAFRRACRLCPRPSQRYRHIEGSTCRTRPEGWRWDLHGPPRAPSYQPWHLRSCWSPCSSSSSNPSPAGGGATIFFRPCRNWAIIYVAHIPRPSTILQKLKQGTWTPPWRSMLAAKGTDKVFAFAGDKGYHHPLCFQLLGETFNQEQILATGKSPQSMTTERPGLAPPNFGCPLNWCNIT